MAAVTRLGDICTGHGCWPPRTNIQGSPNVFINGLPAVRLGDAWSIHCCKKSCHAGTQSGGSNRTFVNGLSVARIGDGISCGSFSAQGSPNTFFG
jgi:uncharacterized Zn-binding protein involved in type VI secretion